MYPHSKQIEGGRRDFRFRDRQTDEITLPFPPVFDLLIIDHRNSTWGIYLPPFSPQKCDGYDCK